MREDRRGKELIGEERRRNERREKDGKGRKGEGVVGEERRREGRREEISHTAWPFPTPLRDARFQGK